MSYSRSDLASYARGYDQAAALAPADERAAFIQRTYAHLCGAVLLFTGLEAAIFTLVPTETLAQTMGLLFGSRWGAFLVMGAFVAVGWVARSWANSDTSSAMQYLGLGLYTVAQALIFVPMLFIASRVAPGTIPAAGLLTALIFVALTAFVFVSKSDFSGWGQYLFWAGMLACGVALAGALFGFSLGILFAAAMVGLSSAYILYDTSNILHQYRTSQHVAASLALFSSVTMLFYYILQILMAFNRRD